MRGGFYICEIKFNLLNKNVYQSSEITDRQSHHFRGNQTYEIYDLKKILHKKFGAIRF